ncbi:MAG: cupin domain-containing protein [Hyphomicrobium sp.]
MLEKGRNQGQSKSRSPAAARGAPIVLAALLAGAAGYAAGSRAEAPQTALLTMTPLLATSKTIMDEPIVYPRDGEAELTAAIMAIAPGGETPWHVHNVPLAGIVLDGEITVDYGDRGTRTFKTGEAIAEAMLVPHRGTNRGDRPVRVFVLYIGAKGVATTRRVER